VKQPDPSTLENYKLKLEIPTWPPVRKFKVSSKAPPPELRLPDLSKLEQHHTQNTFTFEAEMAAHGIFENDYSEYCMDPDEAPKRHIIEWVLYKFLG
jgi:hypothetical protein